MGEKENKKIIQALVSAGAAINEIYNSNNFNELYKADNTPVTRADKASSKIINAALKSLFPSVPVLDEEKSIPEYRTRKKWGRYFLLDPLDGTKEFIKKNGEFCINLAVIENNMPAEGWIYQPLEEKGWYGKKGSGIFNFDKNGVLKKIRQPKGKSNKIRIATSRSFFKPLEAEIIQLIKIQFPVELIHLGSSLKQVELISGNVDMYLKAGPCFEWDTAAGQLFIEETEGAALQLNTFEPLVYNKPEMANPFFVMLSNKLNTPEFISFLKHTIAKTKV